MEFSPRSEQPPQILRTTHAMRASFAGVNQTTSIRESPDFTWRERQQEYERLPLSYRPFGG
jgi:hypothetical protein